MASLDAASLLNYNHNNHHTMGALPYTKYQALIVNPFLDGPRI